MKLNQTTYGFEWGAATVERWASDQKKEWIVLGVTTKKHQHGLQIYVTKTGKIRVHLDGKELK